MDGSKSSPIIYFERDGSGPLEHRCYGGGPIDEIEEWLFRQKLTGISAEEIRIIEQLIEYLK